MPDSKYALILAGGSGERFWPLSRRARPKQLLRLVSEKTLLEETLAEETQTDEKLTELAGKINPQANEESPKKDQSEKKQDIKTSKRVA